MKSDAHNKTVKKAESKGYYITDSSCGSTTMVKQERTGGTDFLHICHDTGKFLGDNSI